MEKELLALKETVEKRKEAWEKAKDSKHPVSIFVCIRRIHSLDQALEMLEKLEEISNFTRI